MELNEIEAVIDKDGQVRIAVHGVKGAACLELTKNLEAALGADVLSRQMTAEAYESSQQQIQTPTEQRT